MKITEYDKAKASLLKALVPAADLLDGRTDREQLAFLSRFAKLINFYDNTNAINGNWEPFLLKDPVFLMARIATTDFTFKYNRFQQNTTAQNQKIQNGIVDDLYESLLNDSFTILLELFVDLEKWVQFMQPGTPVYSLRKYILQQIKDSFSAYLYALIDFRNALADSFLFKRIYRQNQYFVDLFQQQIWTENKTSGPYWDVLGIGDPTDFLSNYVSVTKTGDAEPEIILLAWAYQFTNAIELAGNKLFRFYGTIIRQAQTEYENLKAKPSTYPDTVLLRAFTNLLQNYRTEINAIAPRHLRFYYHQILGQNKLPAKSDEVFVSLLLAKNYTEYTLLTGTQFSAGTDAEKKPIIFQAESNTSLQSTTLSSVALLATAANSNGNGSYLTLQPVPIPSAVQKDQQGNVLSWPTFGGVSGAPTTLGFAFASPMLYLTEGTREIVILIVFANPFDTNQFQMLQTANCFLSTAKAWLLVTFSLSAGDQTNSVALKISLDETAPPIVNFATNPDGISANWPLIKMIYQSYSELSTPPVIRSMEICTVVSNVKTFALYNDSGQLSTKTPFLPFGAMPQYNSNFILGNQEIFSKPLIEFDLQLNWNNLPAGGADYFTNYYCAYNSYLEVFPATISETNTDNAPVSNANGSSNPTTTSDSETAVPENNSVVPKEKKPAGRLKRILNYIQTPFLWVANLLGLSKYVAPVENLVNKIEEASSDTVFNNTAFEVGFEIFQNNQWTNLSMIGPEGLPQATAVQLFPTIFSASNTSEYFYLNSLDPSETSVDPSIQNNPLSYDVNSTCGFLKMTLVNPPEGFGFDLFGPILSYTSLQNAAYLVGKEPSTLGCCNPTDSQLCIAPNSPFAPKLSSISADYIAKASYDFVNLTQPQGYPIELFYYTPFTSYKAYDSSVSYSSDSVIADTLVGAFDTVSNLNGLKMFPAISQNGVLLIQLQSFIVDSVVSLYFQLTGGSVNGQALSTPQALYFTEQGWIKLDLLNDGTNGFTCSGVIQFSVPSDFQTTSDFMQGVGGWLAFAVQGDPSQYAQALYLATNGLKLRRVSAVENASDQIPMIAANTIVKTQSPLPAIGTIVQPFASFGGTAAENESEMNQRVSARIKNKNRAITRGDIQTLTLQEFPDLFYLNSIVESGAIEVYVVKKVSNARQSGAFAPLISLCEETEIESYLTKCIPFSSVVSVANFSFQYINIVCTIAILPGYQLQQVQMNVMQSLNLYFSPWISSAVTQLAPGEGFNASQIAALIQNIAGVSTLSSLTISYGSSPSNCSTNALPAPDSICLPPAGMLFASSMNHTINLAA
jgi:hypothetical protein